jgi:hypothetical protein
MALRLLFFTLLLLLILLPASPAHAQQKEDTVLIKNNKEDTSIVKKDTAASAKDTTVIAQKSEKGLTAKEDSVINKYNPTGATIRSAIIPGWGQFYNKKYWKIPIVYAALGITGGVFFYNLKTYKLLRQAVVYRLDTISANDALIDPRFKNLSTSAIRNYRNEYRQNIDYSVLVFFLFWGLNVVDATVDAHLKTFDVSPDISMKIRPNLNYLNSPGVSFVFFFKEKSKLPLMPLP